jgi:hypothetical protein
VNLHAIHQNRPHYYDRTLSLAFFEGIDEGYSENETYGSLRDVWVEEDKVFGVWSDRDGTNWKILVYEYDSEYERAAIIKDGPAAFITDCWYLDEGHIP